MPLGFFCADDEDLNRAPGLDRPPPATYISAIMIGFVVAAVGAVESSARTGGSSSTADAL